ncbi:Antiviral helicase ski2 [Binucleata daphniae]
MPGYVTIAMLSACIENDVEFASWVGRLRKTTVYVVRTDKRPVPLEHHIVEDENIKAIKNYEKSKDMKMEHQKVTVNNDLTTKTSIMQSVATTNKNSKRSNIAKNVNTTIKNVKTHTKNIANTHKKDNILYLSKFVIKNFLFPSIFFCFSKKKCHQHANKLFKMYLTEHEKKEVQKVIASKIVLLPHEVRKLPQVEEIVKYLSNGIAIHHSGLLPFLKELTEIIFSMNLIEIIIATETFAVGVNFPAKSVVFLSLRKRDDFGTRMLTPGEFMQMSGRAGRRGKDKKGVVLINKDSYSEFEIKTLIAGKSYIRSKFFLSFSMILRMLRINIKIEDVLKASFSENLVQKDLYKAITKLEKLKEGSEKEKNIGEHKMNDEVGSDTIKDVYNDNKNDNKNNYSNCTICCDIEEYMKVLQHFYVTNNALVQKYFENTSNITKENLFDVTFVLRDFTEVEPIKISSKVLTCDKNMAEFRLYSTNFTIKKRISCYKKAYTTTQIQIMRIKRIKMIKRIKRIKRMRIILQVPIII